MANATSWRSVNGNNFARKMWFARLRAAGLFDKKCARGKGVCKQKTKSAATALKQTKYANMSPPSRKGKETALRSKKAIAELLAQGAKKGNSTPQQRTALVKAMRSQGVQRGAKTSLNKVDARVKGRKGQVKKIRYTSATNVSSKSAKLINNASVKANALKTIQKINERAATKPKRTPTPKNKK